MRLKTCFLLTVLGCTVAMAPAELFAQRGGGGFPGGGGGGFQGGGGRPSFDPDAMWNQMSGGSDSVDLNKNPGLKSMMARGGNPLPADGILTKTMFQTAMAQRAAQRSQIPGGPGGFTPGAAPVPVPGSGVPMVVSVTSGSGGPGDKPIIIGAPGSIPQPGAYPGGVYPGGGFPSGGGFPGGDRGDRGDRGGRGGGGGLWGDPDSLFQRADQNRDGKIVKEESRMLLPYFDQIDTNKDGGIDLAELKVFAAAQAAASPGGGNFPGGGFPGGGFPGGEPKHDESENERPIVYRFGKLPKDFPYAALDKDEDGQVSLYEWRTASKSSVDEFLDRDLNGDGFLTAEEWLRGTKTSLGGGEAKGKGQWTGGNMGGGPGTPGASQFGGVRGGRGPVGGGDSGNDKKDQKRGKN